MPSIGRTGHKEELLLQQPRNVLLWKALEGFSHGWSQGNACPKQWTTAGKTQGNFSMDFLRECPSWSSMMFSGIEGYSAIVSPALETCCDKAGHIFSWSLSALSGCMHPENSCGSAKLNPKLQIQLVSHIGRWFFFPFLNCDQEISPQKPVWQFTTVTSFGKKNIQSGTNHSLSMILP